MRTLPKVMIISRGVWDDAGTSSTLSNIFENYESGRLAQIYIETKRPSTNRYDSFFQISEFSLIKKIFNWKMVTGQRVDSSYKEDNDTARKEEGTMRYVRRHRSFAYTILREFLWHLNGWKSKELRTFIQEEKADFIWLTGSPLILMNRLSQYVVKKAQRPYCIYEMDDVYSYRNCGHNPFKYIYRFFLRKRVKALIRGASQVFVISPKMKREFDDIFGIDSMVLTKGIDFSNRAISPYHLSEPVCMVYTGQLLYGRLSTITVLAKAIDAINARQRRLMLKIYTGTHVQDSVKGSIMEKGNVVFCTPVPYSQINEVINQSDVVLFTESLESRYRNLARLSFSTKLTDYFAGGKCIFAIGPFDISPIEYLKENDAAIVATREAEIMERLEYLLSAGVIEEYAKKSFECGTNNHNKLDVDNKLFSRLIEISNNEGSTIS